MAKYGIINRKNQFYEFEADNAVTAVDMYIENIIGFDQKFSMSEELWKTRIKPTFGSYLNNELITIVNGLCINNSNDIIEIISDYDVKYPIADE